jgi:hypothetical protein
VKSRPEEMHRKLKDFITLLRFICPGCSKGFQYESAVNHIKECELALKAIAEGRKERVDHKAVMMQRRITVAEKYNKHVN